MNKYVELTDIKWAVFNMNDIFLIKDGYYNKKPPEEENGDIPFLSATRNNNGVTRFYSKETILKWDKIGEISNKNLNDRIYDANCIVITNNGSVGYAFYQKSKFTCSHDVTPIYISGIEK